MYNKIILAGNLTRDIEIKYSESSLAVGNSGIAVNRKFKSKTGESKEEVLFVDLTFFGRTAEIANQYLQKGSKILVEGRLKLDQWTDTNGAKCSKHSITVENLQMLDSKKESEYLGNEGHVNQNTEAPVMPTEKTKENEIKKSPMKKNFMSNELDGMLVDINNVKSLEIRDNKMYLMTKHNETVPMYLRYKSNQDAEEDKQYYESVLENPEVRVVLIDNNGLLKAYGENSNAHRQLLRGFSYEDETDPEIYISSHPIPF